MSDPLDRARRMIADGAPLWEEYADVCENLARSLRAVMVLQNAGALIETLPHLQTVLRLMREKSKVEERVAALNEKYGA